MQYHKISYKTIRIPCMQYQGIPWNTSLYILLYCETNFQQLLCSLPGCFTYKIFLFVKQTFNNLPGCFTYKIRVHMVQRHQRYTRYISDVIFVKQTFNNFFTDCLAASPIKFPIAEWYSASVTIHIFFSILTHKQCNQNFAFTIGAYKKHSIYESYYDMCSWMRKNFSFLWKTGLS